MFKQELKEKYPFLTEYFEAGFKNSERSIAHSIIFYGHDILAQYELAMEISKLLNCKEFKNESCHCLNCNWVKEKKHPAVLTVSKIDNKPSDDESKTVISIKQSQMVKDSLLNTSDYHRVFIFCDAKMDKEKWIPLGLNEINFQAETANSLLKVIEEPPADTTFFFLTRDKNDLLETIISRSQSFFVPADNLGNKNYLNIIDMFDGYLTLEKRDYLDFAQELFLLSKDHGSEEILTEIQNYLHAVLKTNLENFSLKNKILKDIKSVKIAQDMIDSHINPQLALEEMCLGFVN